jgi:hypothetical protein
MDICDPQFVEKNSNNHLKPKHYSMFVNFIWKPNLHTLTIKKTPPSQILWKKQEGMFMQW